MVKGAYVPDRGDIVWLEMSPTQGREQKGKRPALVLSPKIYNSKIGLLLACPITSKVKGYPFEVVCKVGKIAGVVLADHVRSLDWTERRAKFVVKAPGAVVSEVEAKLLALIRS